MPVGNPLIRIIKVFGEKFVENNKDKCKIVIYDVKNDETFFHELCAFIDLDFIYSKNARNEIFILVLLKKEDFSDLSFMFSGCFTLV